MDISNKFLAFLLVVAIVVSVVGVWYSVDRLDRFARITGFGTQDTGYVNVTLETNTSIIAAVDVIEFGSGQLTGDFAILTTEDSGTPSANWTNTTVYNPSPLIIVNNGNTNLSLDLTSDVDAAGFLGGDNPDFEIAAADNESGTCASGLQSSYTDVTAANQTICTNMGTVVTADSLYVNATIQVSTGASQGTKTATFTFTATTV